MSPKNNIPEFDPNKPFDIVDDVPEFDPSQPFEVVEEKKKEEPFQTGVPDVLQDFSRAESDNGLLGIYQFKRLS